MSKSIISPSQRESEFAAEYVRNGGDADAAGCMVYGQSQGKTRGRQALMRKRVQEEIGRLHAPVAVVSMLTEAQILQDWADIALADPRELVTHRRVNCRHCHGDDFGYQWIDAAEYVAATVAWELGSRNGRPVGGPPQLNAIGFRANGEPHPDCPHCNGEGFGEVFIPDFRTLSPRALKLLAGVKQTKTGIEIAMHSQEKAREYLARHLGMLVDRIKHEGEVALPPPVNLTPEQLQQAIDALNEKI